MRAVCAGALLLGCAVPGVEKAYAQGAEAIRLAQQRSGNTARGPRESVREKINENTLHLMGGRLGAVYIVIAHDIAIASSDGDNLRVLPVSGAGGFANVRDVAYLKGVDLGLTNILTLNELKETGELGPNLDQRVAYIAPLFLETLQVVVRPEINSLEDLRGKRVAFNTAGSATGKFAPRVFEMLKLGVQVQHMPQGDAVAKMRAGELDATVCTCPVPIPAYSNLTKETGFKLLDVPLTPALEKASYYPAAIDNNEYPNLVPAGGKIKTIATYTVLISYNWPRDSARYDRVARFTDSFFTNFKKLLQPPRHPIWKTVNVAGKIRGWRRFPAAQEWLDRQETKTAGASPPARAPRASDVLPRDAAERERLFKEFLEWSSRQPRR